PPDARPAGRGDRLRDAQPARLVRRPGGRNLLHRQPGRLGGDQQALPPGGRQVLRVAEPGPAAAPFEARGQGGRLGAVRLGPVDPATAADPASYRLEHYRYEYTGAYGSPELDRTTVKVDRVDVSRDGLSAELTTGALVKDRVYLLTANGVRSAKNEALVNPAG